MARHLLMVHHGTGPTDDRVSSWCALNSVVPVHSRPCAGDTLADLTEETGGVVIHGGSFNAYDTGKHPFLREEYRIIEQAMSRGVPLLGICQGAQMIAHHMGAFAGAGDHGLHEFGYYEVSPTEAGRFLLEAPLHVAQWHFHTFDIPAGGSHLARSEAFENQAFSVGDHVLGLQFHAEQTIEGFRRWQDERPDAFTKPGAQSRAEQTRLMHLHDADQARWFYATLDRFFGEPA